MQKYIWWKEYLTKAQLVQFSLMIIHSTQLLFYEDCEYPWQFVLSVFGLASSFFVLFANFYFVNYMDKRTKKA